MIYRRYVLLMLRVVLTALFATHLSCHATNIVLKNCFQAPENYYVNGSDELTSTENQQGKSIAMLNSVLGSGAPLTAQCDCTAALTGNSVISDIVYVTTPLRSGSTTGYGYLTDKLDIDVDAYTDTENATAIYIPINTYPSSSPIAKAEPNTSIESESSVCRPGTQPVPGTPQRQFLWSMMSAKFYIKSPILGVETIPETVVIQTAVCIYSGGGCSASLSQPVSNILLSGTLSAPLGCTINAGSTIDIALGNVISTNFVHQGIPPQGYALKNVDITFHCDSAAVSNSDKIKLSLSADQGVSDGESGLIAKMVDRDDIGVRMYDSNSNSIRLDGSAEFPVTLDSQGNGSIKMQAAPVATTDNIPAGGNFEGNVTVKMDIK